MNIWLCVFAALSFSRSSVRLNKLPDREILILSGLFRRLGLSIEQVEGRTKTLSLSPSNLSKDGRADCF
jgi:hypothetical protein